MKTESDIVRFVKEHNGKMSVEQIALQLAVDPAYIVKIRQKAGLNNQRQQVIAKATAEKERIIQIIQEHGPQTVKELARAMNLSANTINSRLYLMRKKGLIEYAAKIGTRNGRWQLRDKRHAPSPKICMHSLPLNRLPEYFRQNTASQ